MQISGLKFKSTFAKIQKIYNDTPIFVEIHTFMFWTSTNPRKQKEGFAYWASNRGCLNVFCYVVVVMPSLLCLCLLCLCSLCLFFVFVWAQAPGAHGPMVQGPWGPWGPYGPGAGAPGPKLQDTHGESNYLLSCRLPTVRQTTYCHR